MYKIDIYFDFAIYLDKYLEFQFSLEFRRCMDRFVRGDFTKTFPMCKTF